MKTRKRIFSFLLTAVLLAGLLPAAAFAEENGTGGEALSCNCETLCTADAIDEDCPVCGVENADLTLCTGTAPDSEPTPVSNDLTALQARVDALPAVEEIAELTDEEQQAVYDELTEIADAFEQLSDDEWDLMTGTDKLEALSAYFGEYGVNAAANTKSITTVHLLMVNGASVPTIVTYGDADFTITMGVEASGTQGTSQVTWTSSSEDILTVTQGEAYRGTATVHIKKADTMGATITVKYEDDKYVGSATVNIYVKQREITITADDKSALTGTELPTLTYQITNGNLASGDSFSTEPTLTASGDTSTMGTHGISVSGGVIKNSDGTDMTASYSITYVPGKLTVSANTYTVTLNTNGGTISSGNVTGYIYGAGAMLPTDVTKDGYTFAGWYEDSDLSGDAVTGISTGDSGDKTFYAKWTANTYSVTLNTDGGKINSGDVTGYTYGTGATLPTDVTKDGYTFAGWYEGSDLSGDAVTEISATGIGDKMFYAKWTETGHSWGEVTYTWTDDGSACTATRVCQNDGTHVETATATVTGKQTRAPTCTEMGKTTYTATFTETWAEPQTKTVEDVPASGHTFGSEWKYDETNHWHECSCGEKSDVEAHTGTTVNAKAATTSEKGYTGDTICEVCGYVISKGEEIPLKEQTSGTDISETGKQDTSPQTGDNGNMVLWGALLVTSAAVLSGTAVYGRKRKKYGNSKS